MGSEVVAGTAGAASGACDDVLGESDSEGGVSMFRSLSSGGWVAVPTVVRGSSF